MHKFNFTAIILFISLSLHAQKRLTLEESVTQQGRAFRADKLLGFQWIPNTNQYTYFGDMGKKLLFGAADNTATTERITLEELSNVLGTKISSFTGITWKSENVFTLNIGANFFEYDLLAKKGKRLATLPEDADHAEFNPQQSAIAYTKANNLYMHKDGKDIAITNEQELGIVSGQSISRNEFGIEKGIFWSPNSRYLAFYQKDETEVANYPFLDITATPGNLEQIKYPMIGQKSEHPRIGIYDSTSGMTVFIVPKNAPDDYLTNLAWTPDEKYLIVAELNRSQNQLQVNLYEVANGNFVRTIFTEEASTWVEPEHAPFFPSKKSSNFIWISERDGFDNLYYYDLNGKLIKQLTANKFVVKDIIKANKTGTEVFFTATGQSALNTLLYKVSLKGKQTLITREEGTHQIAISDDCKWIFDEYTNSATPSKSVIIDEKLKQTVLLVSKNKYEGYQIGSTEIKSIKAADGTTDLFTRLIKPANFDPTKKYPVLIYVYGGPHAQMITNSFLDGASLWMHWLADQGYLVFTVDNRGSAYRGAAFEHVIHRNLGKVEIEDQMQGVNYLKTLPFVDANRLAVHGWSYGGFMTTSLMLRQPDIFKVGIAGGPVTDWKYYEVMYGERYMDTPKENQKGFDQANTLNYVNNLKGKLLLIHGTSDDVVVMQHSLALVKQFIDKGRQVDFFPYPMHKHNVMGKDRVHLMQKVLDYVMAYNK